MPSREAAAAAATRGPVSAATSGASGRHRSDRVSTVIHIYRQKIIYTYIYLLYNIYIYIKNLYIYITYIFVSALASVDQNSVGDLCITPLCDTPNAS